MAGPSLSKFMQLQQFSDLNHCVDGDVLVLSVTQLSATPCTAWVCRTNLLNAEQKQLQELHLQSLYVWQLCLAELQVALVSDVSVYVQQVLHC